MEPSESRPETPESPLASSLYHATNTIDDLTLALTNFSRVPSPEPPPPLTCCCGRDNCEHTRNWLSFKSKLESRLILSAEVGQALLQRHEAYVRRHKLHAGEDATNPQARNNALRVDTSEARLASLVRENAGLEKRLAQALINIEIVEASNKNVLQELEETRTAVSRLTAHHARSIGLDTRLTTLMQEKDDMQQERDSEANRSRLAEVRLGVLQDRSAKLQAEVRRLQDDLEAKRMHRLELSETILQEARTRLEALQRSEVGAVSVVENSEVTKVLEELVADNENLKRDNAELQHLLADAREDVRALHEEVEEQRASLPPRLSDPSHLRQVYTGSIQSSLTVDHPIMRSTKRRASVDSRSTRIFEPLTPETSQRPLSPVDSLLPTPFSQPQPQYPPSHVSFELDEDSQHRSAPGSPEKLKAHKTLLLLMRSRAVQTDSWAGLLSPSSPVLSTFATNISSISPYDGHSESSSVLDAQSSHMALILDRITSLLNRMTQADALTLTNRLKRQHLRGADVGHISRTTIGGILAEVSTLRTQFRALLEDERASIACSRKDLRTLFKLFRDIFVELGQMRATLNDVILDPSIAVKVREVAMNPAKAEAEAAEREKGGANASAQGWMAPISKLFATATGANDGSNANIIPPPRPASRGRPPPRVAPKLGPALSASATTVNVEFSGTGVGRSITSTLSAIPTRADESAPTISQPAPTNDVSRSVMGIFAGAPRAAPSDPWVVVPKGPRTQMTMDGSNTIGRSARRNNPNRMSRNVDAVIDVDGPQGDGGEDTLGPLLERTLRRRGLSDSSIHSTFTNQAEDTMPVDMPEKNSVFHAISRRVQSFRFVTSNTLSGASGSDTPTAASSLSPALVVTRHEKDDGVEPRVQAQLPSLPPSAGPPRATPPRLSGLLPNLSSWTTAGAALEPGAGLEHFLIGSTREDSTLHRTWTREPHRRDF